MSRAALLPTPGDPFLLNFWLKYYKRVWMDEVDMLYVYVNSGIEDEAVNYMRNLVQATPKAVWIFTPGQIEHGMAIKQMLQVTKQDHVMLIEDDGFIFKKGEVDRCFKRIESGEVDVVGSKRGSCSQWLYDTASAMYGIDNSGEGDNGPNFWPNFFFARTDDMRKVTNFGAKFWAKGEMVNPLNQAAPEDQASDTFVEGSLELRALGLKVGYENQYHLNTDDITDYHVGKNAFNGKAGWMHVGSLSSGINGILIDDQGRSLGKRMWQEKGGGDDGWRPGSEAEKLEMERRIVWFIIAHQYSKPERLTKLRDEYKDAITRCVERFGLSPNRIAKRKTIYQDYLP